MKKAIHVIQSTCCYLLDQVFENNFPDTVSYNNFIYMWTNSLKDYFAFWSQFQKLGRNLGIRILEMQFFHCWSGDVNRSLQGSKALQVI